MENGDESLATRRSRRSTAGNRMAAALVEFHADELGQDAEEDTDFVVEIDEQDAFGSDFESTDEEGAQEDVDAAAEKMVQEEEKKKKKAVRSQLEKVTAAAHARQRATFHPEAATVEDLRKTGGLKSKRRVSLGTVIDADTGEVLQSGKRHSQRSYTMLSTSMADARFRDELEKKSSAPRKVKTKIRPPTQAELIGRALDMEEDNIREHKNYLTLEEEKRRKARVVRETVEGPLIRWMSKTEVDKVPVEAPQSLPPQSLPPHPLPLPAAPHPVSQGLTPGMPASEYRYEYFQQQSTVPGSSSTPTLTPTPNASLAYVPTSTSSPYYHPVQGVPQVSVQYPAISQASSVAVLQLAPPCPAPETMMEERTVSKNYVVHEVEQGDGAARPLWKDTMEAMFGDHVNWEDVKVYTGRNRPMTRPVQACPITGQPSRYMDPRTNVPFANVHAYRTLTKLLSHQYFWSETLGCYTGVEDDTDVDVQMTT